MRAYISQRDLAAQGAETPEHRLPRGRPDGGESPLSDLRVPLDGPEEIHGHNAGGENDGPRTGAQLSVPDHRRHVLLSSATRSASRSEAAESADQQRRRHQGGRFRPRAFVRHSVAHVHARDRDAVVPSP